jgi:copper homeostasis protein (lipoprotein)
MRPRPGRAAWCVRFAIAAAMAILPAAAKPAPALDPLPATFAGLLPCADCAGIRYRIDLFGNGAYQRRMTYLRSGRDESFYQLGRWSLSSDRSTLTLVSGSERTLWRIVDHGTLRKLDMAGRPIDSRLPYDLTRGQLTNPIELRGTLSGMFRYMADAARFRECRSGIEWPVATSDDYRALEHAYTGARTAPGAELLVSVEGRIEQRPKTEGHGAQPTLVIERFLRVGPGTRCGDGGPDAALEDSRWRLVSLGGRAIQVPVNQREPWIVLESKTNHVTGSGGCNRISGGYEAGRGALRFSRIASTMMACPSLELETQFLRALDATRSDRVSGRTLELLDAKGSVVAVLEEANLD